MESSILAGVAGACATLLIVALALWIQGRRRTSERADLEGMLLAAQREADALRVRLDELIAVTRSPGAVPAEYVITDLGEVRAVEPVVDPVEVPDRLVLTATLGVPLVKAASFGHGLRRALSPEARNRIWFQMRREVRAARKRRRRLTREYLRDLRARERAGEEFA